MDPRFRVDLIAATPNPQQCVFAAMHQDYSEGFVAADRDSWPDEQRAGEICVKRLLAGERGHYGPLEHAQIVLNVGWFPHSVMQQARTHRVGVSFDVQCLAADTEITFLKASGTLLKIRIADLYHLWMHGAPAGRHRLKRVRPGEEPGEHQRNSRLQLQNMRLRVLNEDTGFFESGHIQAVMSSGIQPVYRLTMEDGRTLDCTANHRLLTPEGWRTMADALSLRLDANGRVRSFRRTAQVLANGTVTAGTGLYRDCGWLQRQIDSGATVAVMAERAGCSPTTIRQWARRHRLPIRAASSRYRPGQQLWNHNPNGFSGEGGITFEHLLNRTGTGRIATQSQAGIDPASPWYREQDGERSMHAPHWAPVYANTDLGAASDPLSPLRSCHSFLRRDPQEAVFAEAFEARQRPVGWHEKPHPQGRRLRAHPLTVVNVEFLGAQMTYDLEVQDPWHNFVANGLVVHNSMRYTGDRIRKAANGELELEEVFYLRPVGSYSDRQGKKYQYDEGQRAIDLQLCRAAAERYRDLLDAGYAEEHARGILPFDYRQHFVVSFSLRAMLHFLDLRAKLDAQQEIRALCDLLWPHLQVWTPQFAEWYEKSRLHRARLAP
jgi:thymidylate synthase (FAD)